MRDRRILATVAAALGAVVVAVVVAFNGESGGSGTPGLPGEPAVANAMEECVRAGSGPPPAQGRLSPPPTPSDDFDFLMPTAYHDWERGTGLYVHHDEELAFFYFEVSGLGVIASGEGTVVEQGADGSMTVTHEGEGMLVEGEQYGPAVLFWGVDADYPEPKKLPLEVHATLKPHGSGGSATAVIDGEMYTMEASLAPEDAEQAACAVLQSAVAGDWSAVVEALPADFTEGLEVDDIAEELRDAMAEMGVLKSAVLDGPLTYEQQGGLGYPVAYGRAKLTYQKGELTTTEGSHIALVYRGNWQLLEISPPDEFEDSGTGNAVTVDPEEGGLVRYTAGDGWGPSLVVQLDPEDPMAGRFVYTDGEEGIFWSKTPGVLFVGEDGMTHLRFEGEGFRRVSTNVRFDEGGLFEPPDHVLDPWEDEADYQDEYSRPERLSLEATFRDGGRLASGSISTSYGTKRFTLHERIPGPDAILERAFTALKDADWQGLSELLEDPKHVSRIREEVPQPVVLSTAEVWPEVSWWEDDVANQHGHFRSQSGAYFGFRLQGEWSREEQRWWVHVRVRDLGLRPTVCVQREVDGSLTAYFGYVSDLGGTLTIAGGKQNRILSTLSSTPDAVPLADVPTTFKPGAHARVASVEIHSDPPTWYLNGSSVTATPQRAHPPTREGNSSAEWPCP